jgi:putative toxin-antitoxin system antitoxin component (TIGR02293 family)
MSEVAEPITLPPRWMERVTSLLGGKRVLHNSLRGPLEAHDMLASGLPNAALVNLINHLTVLRTTDLLETALGMSLRTYQRRQGTDSRPLNAEQSARTWKFAEILAKATEVFGTQEEAERWMERPAMALEQRRPIDLMTTPAGVELVETHLQRLDYGVYT